MAHAEFLRSAWPGADEDFLQFVRNLWAIGSNQNWTLPLDDRVSHAIHILPFQDEPLKAIMGLAVRLTLAPASIEASHHWPLKNAGLSERAIHDVINIVSLFAFMNRFADGNGVTIDKARYTFAIELLGVEALDAHLDWTAVWGGKM